MLDPQQLNTFPLPSSTPAVVPFPNLLNSTQYVKNNFQPCKRQFKRVLSGTENETALKHTLRTYWGHDKFRGPQLEVCLGAMRDWDILLVAPTGIGKSVCFQVPAVTLEHGITLVVSPLIALMRDQVNGLRKMGIKVGLLCNESTSAEATEMKRQLHMGHPQIRVLYLTPETLFSPRYGTYIAKAYEQRQIRRLVIDEAHVIGEWGMTFRSKYRDLGDFRKKYPGIPITAVTASATEEVRGDICAILGIEKKRLAQWVLPFNRKNLFYEVRYRDAEAASDNAHDIADYIIRFRPEAARRNQENGINTKSVTGVIYCRYVYSCVEVAQTLCERGIRARPYHAKLSDADKRSVIKRWEDGDLECVVATIAFGMGVDQPHVRYVIHYDIPKSFEGFYQETGRAGRDGHLSRCVLYYSREDARRVRDLLENEARKALQNAPGAINTGEEANAQAKRRCLNSYKWLQLMYADPANLSDLVCRHIAICRYFGEVIDDKDPEVKKAYCDNMCDYCTDPSAVRRRIFLLTDGIPIASQIERISIRPTVGEEDEPSSADAPDSLTLFHGSDAPASSDPPEPANRPSKQVRRQTSLLNPASMTAAQMLPPPRATVRKSNAQAVKIISDVQNVAVAEPSRRGSDARTPAPKRTKSVGDQESAGRRRNASPGPSRDRFVTPVIARTALGRDSVTRTTDSVIGAGEGDYAVAEPLPADSRKRKRQEDAFRSVQPATGDGPFNYYNGSAPASATLRSTFRTPFKSPLVQERPKKKVGMILAATRKENLKLLQVQMLQVLEEGPLADRLWDLWGRTEQNAARTKVIKIAAQELEAVLVEQAVQEDEQHHVRDDEVDLPPNQTFVDKIKEACLAIRGLGQERIVSAFEQDQVDSDPLFIKSKKTVTLKLVELLVTRVPRV